MKCHQHVSQEAVGICVQCGRALCRDCAPAPAPAPLTCCDACATQASRREASVQLLLDRSVQNARASAVYCYLSSALSGGAAVAAWFWLPSPFLVGFAGCSSLVLVAAGWWHGRAGRKASYSSR